MALKIEKLLSQQSLPLSKYNNIINFVVPEQGSHMDFIQSYIMFNLPVTSPTSQRLSFGHNGKAYYPVCLVRRSRLISSKKGLLTEVNNLNILVNNLMWSNKTTSENLSDCLFGWGSVEGKDYVHSVFADNPANPYVKIPFSHLFPGSLSNTSKLNVENIGELTIQLELEPQKNLFQQVVGARWNEAYSETNSYVGSYPCNDIGGAASAQVTLAGTVLANGVQIGDEVVVEYTSNDVEELESAIITAISQDKSQVTTTFEVPANSTSVSLQFSNQYIHCSPYIGTGAAVSTLTVPSTELIFNGVVQQFSGEIQDITAGPLPLAVDLQYSTYVTADGSALTTQSVNVSITNAVSNQDGTVTLTLSTPIPLTANTSTVAGIVIQPLNTNVNDAVWSVQEAYCFPYRYMGMQDEEKAGPLLLTHYTYEPLPFVSDGYSFAREILVSPNSTNCFLLMPPSTDTNDLYSVTEGVQTYRFFLNDVALSNIPLPISSTVDLDMRQRVFNNSEFPMRNLNVIKNAPDYINVAGAPQPYCAKIKPSMFAGSINYDDSDMIKKPLRVEINGENMATAKTIYFFKEEMKVVQ